jgi:hypothetical protein
VSERIRRYSSDQGYTEVRRSVFGWYFVTYNPERGNALMSRHLFRRNAFFRYMEWCWRLDIQPPPSHFNCRCVTPKDIR